MDYKVNFRNNFPQQIQLIQLRRNNRSSFSFYIIIWNLCKDVTLILILLKFLDIRQLNNIYFGNQIKLLKGRLLFIKFQQHKIAQLNPSASAHAHNRISRFLSHIYQRNTMIGCSHNLAVQN